MNITIRFAIAFVLSAMSHAALRADSSSDLPDDMKLALDVLTWIKTGNSKFDHAYGDESNINSKEELILSGPAFEALAEAGLLPDNCVVARDRSPSTSDWSKQCAVSLSPQHANGTYTLSVVIGTQGRGIYEIRRTGQGYQVRAVAMS